MKSILRERLLEQLLQIPELVNLHLQHRDNFVGKAAAWLHEGEQKLQPLRSPLVSRLASMRSQLLAIEDGLLNEHINNQQRSTRKKQKAFASHILAQVEQEMRSEIHNIDAAFDELKDKLAQLIGIVSSQTPLPYSDHLTSDYLDRVWQSLAAHEATHSMSAYIKAQTDTVDRRFLLQQLMDNFMQQITPIEKPQKAS